MILIDMPMPENCSECRFETECGYCKAMPDNFCGYTDEVERPKWCPLSDAVTMLKEQETTNTREARIFQCAECGYGFDDIFLIDECNYPIVPKYCPNCGRAVKWE